MHGPGDHALGLGATTVGDRRPDGQPALRGHGRVPAPAGQLLPACALGLLPGELLGAATLGLLPESAGLLLGRRPS